MFVGKWQAIQTSGSVLGDAESAAGFGYDSQRQPSCCLSPFLPCSGDSRALLLGAWPKQSKGQVHTGGPCVHSQLRMPQLRVPAEAMPPAWYGQGSALCLLGAAPGLWLHWTGIFFKGAKMSKGWLSIPGMPCASWSIVSKGLTAMFLHQCLVELLRLHRCAKESPIKLVLLKAKLG